VAGFNSLVQEEEVFDKTTTTKIGNLRDAGIAGRAQAGDGGDVRISPASMAANGAGRRAERDPAVKICLARARTDGLRSRSRLHRFSGQSWPTLVYLPVSALSIDAPMDADGGGAFNFASFIQEVTPARVRINGWGHMVGWASYHDQCCRKGCGFFGGGVSGNTEKPDQVNKFWDRAREAITAKNQFGVSANEAGPIWMGLRLDTAKSAWAYNRLV